MFNPVFAGWLALMLWRGVITLGIPRGLYHLAVPRAYDNWAVRHAFKAAWAEHRRECRGCEVHRPVVLAEVEDWLRAEDLIRHGLPREPDMVDRATTSGGLLPRPQ